MEYFEYFWLIVPLYFYGFYFFSFTIKDNDADDNHTKHNDRKHTNVMMIMRRTAIFS